MTITTITNFERITNFDLQSFLVSYEYFSDNCYQDFVEFYKGNLKIMNQESLLIFLELAKTYEGLIAIIDNVGDFFETTDYWELMELIDDIGQAIQTTSVIAKFLKVTEVRSFKKEGYFVEHLLEDYETLESISLDYLGDEEYWKDIAVSNDVEEIDYDEGDVGDTLQIQQAKGMPQTLEMDSVVDSLYGEHLYGLDIDKQFLFVNDDVQVLSYQETFIQTANGLLNLRKGDLPELRKVGISQEDYIGNNLGEVSLPFLIMDIRNTFALDDTIKSVDVINSYREGATIFLSYKIESMYNYVYEVTKNL